MRIRLPFRVSVTTRPLCGGNDGFDLRALSGCRDNRQRSPGLVGTLFHAEDAIVTVRASDLLQIETRTIVEHPQAQTGFLIRELHVQTGWLAMSNRVLDGFLSD